MRTLPVGTEPTGVAANPKKNEIYVVNTGSSNVSVIDAEQNKVVATIGVHGRPYFIDVSPDGHRAYVANSGSANVSVLDLDHRTVAATLRVGRKLPAWRAFRPMARPSSSPTAPTTPSRSSMPRASPCARPSASALIPKTSPSCPIRRKAFVSCSGSGQVASIDLKNDKLLALLDVGKSPVSLALKPDGGELVAFNFDAGSISIIETTPNEVLGSYLVGAQPTRGVVSLDNSRLYISNFGSNNIAVYDIDLGKVISVLPVGTHPDALALSQNQNYLLVLDSGSGDLVVIQKRKPKKFEPSEYSLLTIIPVGMQPNQIVVKSFLLTKPAVDGR